MKFSDLKFNTIEINGETLKYARTTLPNGFSVSFAKEENVDSYNAAIIKNDTMVITEIHGRTDMFIVGGDYTFDLVDARKITTFLKNVEKLTSESDFTDVSIEDDMLYIGRIYPISDKLLNLVKKITPFKNDEDDE